MTRPSTRSSISPPWSRTTTGTSSATVRVFLRRRLTTVDSEVDLTVFAAVDADRVVGALMLQLPKKTRTLTSLRRAWRCTRCFGGEASARG